MDDDQKILRLERYFRDPIVGEGYLHKGARNSEACRNIRIALRFLGFNVVDGNEYDDELEVAVTDFQNKYDHRFKDGLFGPGTRKLLTKELINEGGEHLFRTMRHPEGNQPPNVFLSYAWEDDEVVNKIDQWLRDHGIRVSRDTTDFLPGRQLTDEIIKAIAGVDKVIAVYSPRSKHRDWPQFEIKIAEQEEQTRKKYFLIYLALDGIELPRYDTNRIAVMAKGKPLREVGSALLRGILGQKSDPKRYEYDENEIL
jgi:TIR domain